MLVYFTLINSEYFYGVLSDFKEKSHWKLSMVSLQKRAFSYQWATIIKIKLK